jgi:hypothetical protein
MNPFTYIEQAPAAIAQHPFLALGIAVVAGILSTSA